MAKLEKPPAINGHGGAWRGLRAKVSQCTVCLDGGKVCDKSRRLLSEKYNIDG